MANYSYAAASLSSVSSGTWAVAFLAVAAAYYAVSSALAWHRLRAFSGPRLASFSYLWMARAQSSERMWEFYRDASAAYGTVARVGPNELVTDDPAIIRRLSTARSAAAGRPGGYRRSIWYELNGIDPYDISMFSLRDNAAHDRLKALTAPGYAGRDNPTLEAELDGIIAELVGKIRDKYAARPGGDKKQPMPSMDFARMAQYFTLDSITKIAFGEEFGFLRREEDVHSYIKSIEEAAPLTSLCGDVPALGSVVASPLVLKFTGPKLTDKTGLGRLLAISKEIVSKRFGPDAKDQKDMLGSFVRHGMTQKECQTEALFQILAGSDTTATAIRATMLHVMTTPRVYNALQAEIDRAQMSSPITNEEALTLPYLQAVIWEGLRINPPFTGLPFKEVPPQGDTLDGRFVPGGTCIAPSIWSLSRRRDVFGEDSEMFLPERWLEAGEDKRTEMRRTTELIFGYGRWACAGKAIAFLELNKVIPELLRNFDFQLVNPLKPVTTVNHNLFFQKDMWVRVTERQTTVA